MDINSAKVNNAGTLPKDTSCICNYPNEKFRNGSGHRQDCPVHQAFLKRKGGCNDGNCGCD
jgi:hypothetical protein